MSIVFGSAVMHHIEHFQNVDKDTTVRYPQATYMNYDNYVDQKGAPSTTNNRARVFGLDTGAGDIVNKLNETLVTSINQVWLYSENRDCENLKDLSEKSENYILYLYLVSKQVKDDRFKQFEARMSENSAAMLRDLVKAYKSPAKTSSKKGSSEEIKQPSEALLGDIMAATIKMVYQITKYVAAAVLSHTAKTTTKIVSRDILTAIQIAAYPFEEADMTCLYSTLINLGNSVIAKEVHVVAKAASGSKATDKKKTPTKKHQKDSISDDDKSDDEEEVQKTSKPKKKPAKKDDSSDSDDSDADE